MPIGALPQLPERLVVQAIAHYGIFGFSRSFSERLSVQRIDPSPFRQHLHQKTPLPRLRGLRKPASLLDFRTRALAGIQLVTGTHWMPASLWQPDGADFVWRLRGGLELTGADAKPSGEPHQGLS